MGLMLYQAFVLHFFLHGSPLLLLIATFSSISYTVFLRPLPPSPQTHEIPPSLLRLSPHFFFFCLGSTPTPTRTSLR